MSQQPLVVLLDLEKDQSFIGTDNERDRSLIGTDNEQDQSFVGTGDEQDQSLIGTGDEHIAQGEFFGDEAGFPISPEHPGEKYFRATPFVDIKPSGYVQFRFEVAEHDPLRVADEWNEAMLCFRSCDKRSPKIARLRRIPPQFRKLLKGQVTNYIKGIHA
ncbi:hypothetical protein BGX26_006470, partial [Mortierella sp. AD094]